MPYTIRKVRKTNCYEVKNKITGKVHAKCTTKKKAEAQKRILYSAEAKIHSKAIRGIKKR